MRRNAGSFLRQKLLKYSLYELVALGFLLSLGIGSLAQSIGTWIGTPWWSVPLVAAVGGLVAFITMPYLQHGSNRWSVEKLEKGLAAESRVGQIIESAITSKNCAVSHSVTSIAKVGDIDHLVATPRSLWVIETKYKKVPKQKLPEVLSRIAANTIAVRRWAPEGTIVRGCLILAYESRIRRRKYDSSGEEITAYTPRLLLDEMRDEVQQEQLLNKGIAPDIWKLGEVPNLKQE